MKILVVGSGGREHAICWAIKKSRHNPQIYCAPGNAGIAEIARCVNISATEIQKLAEFAVENSIDLTIVGGETSLAAGIVDEFENRNLKIVGASRKASRLEASKIFAKDFMTRHKIPTAGYKVADSAAEALKILQSGEFGNADAPVVVKADGLASGKGVVVAKNRKEAEQAILQMSELVGAEAASRILLEETLIGREVSLLLFADGKDFALMPPARDHKRIGEGDTGANTGGMGTIADKSLLSENQIQEIIEKIIKPTLAGAAAEGFPFRGILFLGLMMTERGAQVLEYNVRFGDPETQSILIRLNSDFVEICQAIVEGKLGETAVEFSDESSACIVLAARNYPAKPKTGDIIQGLENMKSRQNAVVFHAGTARNENGDFVTAGGRVLGVTATGKDLENALQHAYAAANEISWNGMQYRRDIGK
ncbi:MAG TPA: phosphoribosylamine--glycine ligase [Pyrinomonadaceae bacterium]|jgi:phosphoribosylamine--glycine ligase